MDKIHPRRRCGCSHRGLRPRHRRGRHDGHGRYPRRKRHSLRGEDPRGVIRGRLAPTNEEEHAKASDAGHDASRILTTNELGRSDNCYFAATGITDGDLLIGVQYPKSNITTQSNGDAIAVENRMKDRRRTPPDQVVPVRTQSSAVLTFAVTHATWGRAMRVAFREATRPPAANSAPG